MSWGGRGKRSHGWYQNLKRMMDVVAVCASMPATIPIGLFTAAVVSAGLGRPVLYRQPRMGRDEKEFEILKFRTMTDETDSFGMPLPDSERLTGLGKALRKSSLDELPQLINVAKGEMSLVGPRPLFPDISRITRMRNASDITSDQGSLGGRKFSVATPSCGTTG